MKQLIKKEVHDYVMGKKSKKASKADVQTTDLNVMPNPAEHNAEFANELASDAMAAFGNKKSKKR